MLALLAPQVASQVIRCEGPAYAIAVPADFPSIQAAVNSARPGDTVFVAAGVYYEHVIVNKTITLLGEGGATVVDGDGTGTVIQVTADHVKVTGFTLQNTGWKWGRAGVEIYGADSCVVENNVVYWTCHQIRLVESHGSKVIANVVSAPRDPFPQSAYGIRLENCTDCLVLNNNVSDNIGGIHFEGATNCVARGNRVFQNSQGIRLYSPCVDTAVVGNIVVNNTNDGMLVALPSNTTFVQNMWCHNSFINNTQSFIGDLAGCVWDNGQEGNFWSTYAGADADGDGIGDIPHTIDAKNQDRYPLMHPWSPLPVHNVNTGLGYAAIQAAIDAPQTGEGHRLVVDPGTYTEHLAVHKSVTIVGSEAETTIVDGAGSGPVVHITASGVAFSGFTVRNGGNASIDASGPGYGIFVDYCQDVTITANAVTACRYGIYLFHSARTTLMDNTVSANYEDGIWLYFSENTVLARNCMMDNKYNFGVYGQAFAEFNNTIDLSNTVNAKPIQYVIEVSDRVLDSGTEAGTVYLINAHNVTVRDLCLSGNGNGVFLWNATASTVENVTVSGCNYGIYLQESDGNVVRGNRCPDNWVGIFLESSDENQVTGNTAAENEKGISLYRANANSLEGNTLTGNLFGVRFFAAGANQMWHNNLVENTYQTDLVIAYGNSFDDGYEGNYWSDYDGADAADDAIGDTAYVIGNERDRYPLMGRFYKFTVSSVPEELCVGVVCSSLISGFSSEREENTLSLNVTVDPAKPQFCRLSIPTTLLRPPYTVKAFNSSWFNAPSHIISSTDESVTILYFEYDSSVQLITIAGARPPSPIDAQSAVIVGAVVVSVCFAAYFAATRRKRRTKIINDAQSAQIPT